MKKGTIGIDARITIMKQCLEAWNRADADLVASFYTDDCDYRDPTVPAGIASRDDFIAYLKLIFKVWPSQSWVPKNVMPHTDEDAFTVDYDFRIANDRVSIKGQGMDRIEFRGDKIRLNHVYLNADRWKDWIGRELKGG
jgi:hypothetical protein